MGFFSWKTKDTGRSIANRHSKRPTFTVYMHDHKGGVHVEKNYEGYGLFGGVDYYELLAMMNGRSINATIGIELAFYEGSDEKILFPQLTENPQPPAPEEFYIECERCEDQGYFYK